MSLWEPSDGSPLPRTCDPVHLSPPSLLAAPALGQATLSPLLASPLPSPLTGGPQVYLLPESSGPSLHGASPERPSLTSLGRLFSTFSGAPSPAHLCRPCPTTCGCVVTPLPAGVPPTPKPEAPREQRASWRQFTVTPGHIPALGAVPGGQQVLGALWNGWMELLNGFRESQYKIRCGKHMLWLQPYKPHMPLWERLGRNPEVS